MYSDYRPVRYRQMGGAFIENLSVLDYMFNEEYRISEEWTSQSVRDCGESAS